MIASDVGGIREIVREGLDGFLVAAEDAAALAERMRRLLHDDALCRKMSQEARQRFLQAFEQSAAAGKLLDWLEIRLTSTDQPDGD